MPKPQVKEGARPVKWRTVKTRDGRTIQIAVVKKGK